jgi:hypothetical protein
MDAKTRRQTYLQAALKDSHAELNYSLCYGLYTSACLGKITETAC